MQSFRLTFYSLKFCHISRSFHMLIDVVENEEDIGVHDTRLPESACPSFLETKLRLDVHNGLDDGKSESKPRGMTW